MHTNYSPAPKGATQASGTDWLENMFRALSDPVVLERMLTTANMVIRFLLSDGSADWDHLKADRGSASVGPKSDPVAEAAATLGVSPGAAEAERRATRARTRSTSCANSASTTSAANSHRSARLA